MLFGRLDALESRLSAATTKAKPAASAARSESATLLKQSDTRSADKAEKPWLAFLTDSRNGLTTSTPLASKPLSQAIGPGSHMVSA